MTLTEADRVQIRNLLQAATTRLVSARQIEAVLRNEPGARDSAIKRLCNVTLQSRHLVAYDILLEQQMQMEHLSVSHPNGVTEPDVLVIAAEFGLGDKATWSMYMPPVPPMRAFHIMRSIAPTKTQ
jgi:hypothetical protein